MKAVPDPITQAFTPLLGHHAWGVDKGQGSILSFDFGTPHLVIREPYASKSNVPKVRKIAARRNVRPHGEWFLFVFCCRWRVMVRGEEIAHDEASDDAIREAVREIDGQKLVGVELGTSAHATTFHFDLGAVLLTWPYEGDEKDEEAELWSLSMPGGDVLSYRADGRYSWGPSTERPDEVRWHELPLEPAIYRIAASSAI